MYSNSDSHSNSNSNSNIISNTNSNSNYMLIVNSHRTASEQDRQTLRPMPLHSMPARVVRPVRLLRVWISGGLTQADS